MTTAAAAQPLRGNMLTSVWAFVRHHVLTVYSLLAFTYLMLPIGVVIAFSFNNPKGRFNFTWEGFTLKSWLHPFGYPGLGSAVRVSVVIRSAIPMLPPMFRTNAFIADTWLFCSRGMPTYASVFDGRKTNARPDV